MTKKMPIIIPVSTTPASTTQVSTKPPRAPYYDTKAHLLAVGYELLAQKGFSAVGLQQILTTAGVPKGSFYHYFASKEAFGAAIIEHYFGQYQNKLLHISSDYSQSNQALYHYFARWYATQQNGCDVDKCLLVKLSAEVADLSEPMRQALYLGYEQTCDWIAKHIEIAVKSGDIELKSEGLKTISCAKTLANRWYFAWLGASLVAKISCSNAPLDDVWQLTCHELNLPYDTP